LQHTGLCLWPVKGGAEKIAGGVQKFRRSRFQAVRLNVEDHGLQPAHQPFQAQAPPHLQNIFNPGGEHAVVIAKIGSHDIPYDS
jgi:hypothetical protein